MEKKNQRYSNEYYEVWGHINETGMLVGKVTKSTTNLFSVGQDIRWAVHHFNDGWANFLTDKQKILKERSDKLKKLSDVGE